MAPTRRYLRISPHSVLEVRVYLDNPADAARWLLRERDPALPRVIEAVKPLVLPKLKEENERERARKKGQKGAGKRGIKDVVVEKDFDVSIFLTELSTPHCILTRQRLFDPKTPRLQSTSSKMTGTKETPMDVDATTGGAGIDTDPMIIQEPSDEDEQGVRLADISPTVTVGDGDGAGGSTSRGERERLFVGDSEDDDDDSTNEEAKNEEEEEDSEPHPPQPSKTPQDTNAITIDEAAPATENTEPDEDKKKMGLRTTYDGFRIYGRILCLVVTRKTGVRGKGGEGEVGGGKATMESFISTQLEREREREGMGMGE